jgi:hypothetical protein
MQQSRAPARNKETVVVHGGHGFVRDSVVDGNKAGIRPAFNFPLSNYTLLRSKAQERIEYGFTGVFAEV